MLHVRQGYTVLLQPCIISEPFFKWRCDARCTEYLRPAAMLLTLRRLMSYIYIYIYIYGAPILDVSRSHTTTQHSR